MSDPLSPPEAETSRDGSENICSEKSSSSSRGLAPVILTLYVQVGEGEEKCVEVREGDSATELAQRFCSQYGLDPHKQPELERKFRLEISRVQQSAPVKNKADHREPGPETLAAEHGKYFGKGNVESSGKEGKMFDEVERALKGILRREAKDGRSQQSTKASNKESGRNRGPTLYERWLKSRDSMDKYRQETQQEREKKELEGATFRPKINSRSKSIVMSTHEQRLSKYAESVRTRADVRKSMSIVEEMKKCTFRPEIIEPTPCPKSRAQAQIISPAIQQQILKNYQKSRAKSHSGVRQQQCSYYSSKPSQKIKAADPRPKAAPAVSRQRDTGKLAGHYCSLGRQQGHKCKETIEKKNKTEISQASTRIARERRAEIFGGVFAMLDQDADGEISYETLGWERLPRQMVEAYAPLFAELEKENLNLEEFVEAAENLYNSLGFADRTELLSVADTRRIVPAAVELPFKPKINDRSRYLAEKANPCNAGFDERCRSQQSRLRTQIEHQQRKKAGKEMVECTFRPNIHHGSQW